MATSVASDDVTEGGAVRGALRETGSAIREVFAHPALRRMQLALAGSLIGDWAYNTAVIVWAYSVGGGKAVGIWTAIRLMIMAATAPLAASLADRLPRKLVLVGSDLTRCALVAGAAACIAAGTGPAPVYALATLTSLVGCVFRPAQAAWMPSLADRPEQLSASNGVSSTIESISMFAGPAFGAALIAATSVHTVFFINAATYLWSAALVVSIHVHASSTSVDKPRREDDRDAEGALATIFAGFREIGRSRDLQVVAVLSAAQTIVAGAASVFTVLLAVHALDSGARGVGFINAVLGVGAIIGGFVAIGRSSRQKLMLDLTAGVLLWSLPLLLIVAWPSGVAVYAAASLLGLGSPLVDVSFCTVVQRIAPDRVLGRVFGAIEGLLRATGAGGAAAMPFLADAAGLRTGLAVVALVVGVPAILLVPAARRIDRRLHAPAGLELLQRLPIFVPIGPARLESLARHLVRTEAAAGDVIVTEGEVGDLFYLIESGRVAVSHGDAVIREQSSGEYFGEIALLRDVPRTATVTAVTDTVLLTVARAPFLDAVAGNAESSTAFEDVVIYRMRF